MASRYALHLAKWHDCTACSLHEHRGRMVFARGKIPCDVLFIGEAPGESEDVLGAPFKGPAGKLLDQIVERATMNPPHQLLTPAECNCGEQFCNICEGGLAFCKVCKRGEQELLDHPHCVSLKLAFTNLVCCIPRDGVGAKAGEPSRKCIQACKPRLEEFIELANPRLIVAVGSLAEQNLSGLIGARKWCAIRHPAYILRATVVSRGLEIQRATTTLSDAVDALT